MIKQTAELRASGIGGSDIGVIFGVNKWKTPTKLWLEKRGLSEQQEESEAMHWGNVLEEPIRAEYVRRTGNAVYMPADTFRDGCLMANPDGLIGEDGILEIKTARTAEGWGDENTEDIPPSYYLQVQHYLAVTGRKWAHVAVLIGGSDYRQYSIGRNEAVIESIREMASAFWTMVQDGIEPKPMTPDDVQALHPSDNGDKIEATPEILMIIDEYKGLIEHIKRDEERADRLKTMIIEYICDRSELTANGKKIASWKTQTRESIDTKALLADHPDIAGKYKKTSSFRTFRA